MEGENITDEYRYYVLQINTREDGKDEEPVTLLCTKTVTGETVQLDVDGGSYKMALGISPSLVTVSRLGENSYSLEFTEGTKQFFKIAAPFGELPVTLETHKIDYTNDETADSLTLSVDYSLHFSEESVKIFKISILCFKGEKL